MSIGYPKGITYEERYGSEKARNIRRKISEALTGHEHSGATRQKISESREAVCKVQGNGWLGRNHSEETKKKIAASKAGHEVTKETRRRISKAMTDRVSNKRNKSYIDLYGPERANEVRLRMSKSHIGIQKGEKSPSWKGGTSFLPYCFKFNFSLKERVRNRHGRSCVLCGISEMFYGRRLDVHHIDGNKMQGCDGAHWSLVPLCNQCHGTLNGEKDGDVLNFLLWLESQNVRFTELI